MSWISSLVLFKLNVTYIYCYYIYFAFLQVLRPTLCQSHGSVRFEPKGVKDGLGPCMLHVTDLVRPHLHTAKTTMGMMGYLTTIMILNFLSKLFTLITLNQRIPSVHTFSLWPYLISTFCFVVNILRIEMCTVQCQKKNWTIIPPFQEIHQFSPRLHQLSMAW